MKGFVPEFFDVLSAYDWPGNVRELSQALERAIASAGTRPQLYPKDLPTDIRAKLARDSADALHRRESAASTTSEDAGGTFPRIDEARAAALAAAEEEYLRAVLARTGGDIALACSMSGLSRSRLYSLLKKYRIALSSPTKG